jgi:hypothetical protein
MGKQAAAPSAAPPTVEEYVAAGQSRENAESLVELVAIGARREAWLASLTPEERDARACYYEVQNQEFTARTAEERAQGFNPSEGFDFSTEWRAASEAAMRAVANESRLNKSSSLARRTTQPVGGRAQREARNHRQRGSRRGERATSSSSDDPGDSDPNSERRCEACGADLSHRRRDARTCDAQCRKALSRGKVAPPPPPVVRRACALEDEIDSCARQRHLAWSAPQPDTALIEYLAAELADLYAELRRQRARRPLPGFAGRTASVVRLPASPLRRRWSSSQPAYQRREAVPA